MTTIKYGEFFRRCLSLWAEKHLICSAISEKRKANGENWEPKSSSCSDRNIKHELQLAIYYIIFVSISLLLCILWLHDFIGSNETVKSCLLECWKMRTEWESTCHRIDINSNALSHFYAPTNRVYFFLSATAIQIHRMIYEWRNVSFFLSDIKFWNGKHCVEEKKLSLTHSFGLYFHFSIAHTYTYRNITRWDDERRRKKGKKKQWENILKWIANP